MLGLELGWDGVPAILAAPREHAGEEQEGREQRLLGWGLG